MKHTDYLNSSWNVIIHDAVQGSEAAKTAVYEMTRKMVYDNCEHFIHDEEIAMDLSQEVYLRIFKNLSKLKEPTTFVKWAKTITINTCLEHLRSQKKNRIVYFAPGDNEDEPDPYETYVDYDHQIIPDKELVNKETRAMVHKSIEKLPIAQGTTLFMYYYDGLSVSEIAKKTHVSMNTVKSRLSYGRKKIRSSVEEYHDKHGVSINATPVLLLCISVLFSTQIKYCFSQQYSSTSFLYLSSKSCCATGSLR